MNNRTDLAKYFHERGYNTGAEIGVAEGRYSEVLCQNIPNLKLYCVDLWKPYPQNWRGENYQENAYKQAQEKLKPYNATLIRKPSVEASLEIPDRSLDFVFIDGDHTFDHVMTDIILWSRKVRKRGVVSGHDWTWFKNSGVVQAVSYYCIEHKIELNMIQRNNDQHHDDKQPCWWFEKSWN
jgi:hypothetical protein